MKRARPILGVSAAALAALVPWLAASCATTQDAVSSRDDAATPVPDLDAGVDAAEGAADGGCDAADPSCVTKPISCDEAAWCPVQTGVSSLYALVAVSGSSKTDVWAVGSGGTIVHWDGAAWTATPTGLKNTFHAVWARGANEVWAVSSTDAILRSGGFAGGKATWEREPSPTDEWNVAPLYAIWGDAKGHLRLGARSYNLFEPNGDFGPGNQFVREAADGGAAWVGVKGTATIHGIWGSSADDLWIVGDNSQWVSWQLGYTAHGTRSGGELTWTEVDSQASVMLEGVWGSGPGDVWAVGDKGTIRHITAGAAQWAIVPSPTTEALHAIWGSGPGDIWAVGDEGTILHYDGKAWRPSVVAFPVGKKKPHLYGVWGSGPDDVWIVGDGIALHHTGGGK